MILAIEGSFRLLQVGGGAAGGARHALAAFTERLDEQPLAGQAHLRRLAHHVGGQGGLGGAVDAGDGHQLRLHAGA